jgi:hypothetical protein
MVNPYAPPFRVIPSNFNFWRVMRPDGSFVALLPREHCPNKCDARNTLKLMARAFDHGLAAAPSHAEKDAE